MRLILSILTFFVSIYSVGQKAYCDAAVDKNMVGQNEPFKYQITTNQDCEIVPPNFKDLGFQIVGGPYQGQNSYYSNTNGKASQGVEYSLTYHLIGPDKGNFVIPPAKIKCKNKTFTSAGVKITIGESSAAITPEDGAKTHFLKATVNKKKVYVGEAFVVSLKFYSKKRPSQMGQVEIGKATPMFRDNLFKDKVDYTLEEEVIDGEHYYVIELYMDVCIPLTIGIAEINPYYASMRIGTDIWNNQWIEAYSNKIEVEVIDLPDPQPTNFNGLVGEFDLIHSISKTVLNAGQIIDLNIKIHGSGNFNAFDDPILDFPDVFHVFEPETERELNLTANGINGMINYHFMISPDEAGKYILPPFSFSYFDLETKKYKSLTTQEFDINVKEGKINRDEYEDPVVVADDINYIHTENSSFFGIFDFLFGTIFYWLALLSPLMLASIFVFIKIKKENRSEEEITQGHQKDIKKSVFRDLKNTLDLINSGQEKEGLKLFQQSLINYFMVKLELSMSSLSEQAISNELRKKDIDENLISDFKTLWNKIEMAQYAPTGADDLNITVKEAEALIKKMNTKL